MRAHLLALFVFKLLLIQSPLSSAEPGQQFPVVGFHVDLRLQIMPMPALKALARDLSQSGFNVLIMEWEATYPYRDHAIISNRLAYSQKEVRGFIEYCDGLGLDVIPLQQNLGHAEYILSHERYAYLRESKKDHQQICPLKTEAARELFEELYDDMLSVHTSKYVHIGGDETRLLGVCSQCADILDEHGEGHGKSKLYVDYMRMISDIVIERGKTPLLWADMILAHPESIADMPKEAIYIDWNYGWDFDRFGEDPADLISKHGLTFWGASAIRSTPDDYNVTDWSKHMQNQSDYIPYARRAGFEGMILTSWSTSGVYGYEWFMSEVTELYPLRHPYPHDGFRMNVEAFVAGLVQNEPIVPAEFAREYAMERFGLTSSEGDQLWDILSSDVLHAFVTVGSRALSGVKGLAPNRRTADADLAAVRELQAKFSKIVPKSNPREFGHFGLQIACREFYLQFRSIEEWVQSEGFTAKDKPRAVRRLVVLLELSVELDKRLLAQFDGVLYESEIHRFNDYRSKNVRLLKQRMANDR